MEREELEIVRLNIQLTKKCNQRCKSCNSYNMDCNNEMSIDDIKQVINETCNIYKIKNIAFTGGEPTIRKDILEIVSYAKQYADNVSITTNGFYCSSKERVKELINAGANRFSFSYHGVGKQDEFSGIEGSEKRIRNAIEWLAEERKTASLYIKIGTLFNGKNISDVEKVLNYAESQNVDLYIEVWDNQNVLWCKDELKDYLQIKEEEKDILSMSLEKIRLWKQDGRKVLIDENGIKFMKYWFEQIPIKGGCPLGNTDIYIESNGNVRSGCWFLEEVGNIKKSSMKDIVKGERYKKNLENMWKRECQGCTCGYLMQAKYMDS